MPERAHVGVVRAGRRRTERVREERALVAHAVVDDRHRVGPPLGSSQHLELGARERGGHRARGAEDEQTCRGRRDRRGGCARPEPEGEDQSAEQRRCQQPLEPEHARAEPEQGERDEGGADDLCAQEVAEDPAPLPGDLPVDQGHESPQREQRETEEQSAPHPAQRLAQCVQGWRAPGQRGQRGEPQGLRGRAAATWEEWREQQRPEPQQGQAGGQGRSAVPVHGPEVEGREAQDDRLRHEGPGRRHGDQSGALGGRQGVLFGTRVPVADRSLVAARGRARLRAHECEGPC